MSRSYFYVGISPGFPHGELFKTKENPNDHVDKYRKVYTCVIGPFRTKRGAKAMIMYGYNNPHIRHVIDAEAFASDPVNKRLIDDKIITMRNWNK